MFQMGLYSGIEVENGRSIGNHETNFHAIRLIWFLRAKTHTFSPSLVRHTITGFHIN